MKELYKVHRITVSLLSEPYLDISCEFGLVMEEDGVLFFETHIFDNECFDKVFNRGVGSSAIAKMTSFDDIIIEIPDMVITKIETKGKKITFQCINYIIVYEEDKFFSSKKYKDLEMKSSQLLSIDLWGLDLLIKPALGTTLIVGDAPFDMLICKDERNGNAYICFPRNENVAHNTLTEDLFEIFRDSLIGYLSLINGAHVQIKREYYNGFSKIYSYSKVENLSRSHFICGKAKSISLSPILFEFDNYIRWNKVLNLNKFIHHICNAQQVINYEDRAFILILVLEGLSKKYLEALSEEKVSKTVMSVGSFDVVKKELFEIIEKHSEIPFDISEKFKSGIKSLNNTNLATLKFGLLLKDVNIEETKEIKKLFKKVRSTLVHEAELKDYNDYQLLSELIREIILRIIDSKFKRYSYFEENVILGEKRELSFCEYIKRHKLNINFSPIFAEDDTRIKLRIHAIK